jgi:hypothetical protein
LEYRRCRNLNRVQFETSLMAILGGKIMRFAEKPNFPSMLFVAICLLTTHPAFSQTPYYAGKTITMIRGEGPAARENFNPER